MMIAMLMTSGCTSIPTTIPETTTKASMGFTVDNVPFIGTATLPGKSSHIINFKPTSTPVKFMLHTCHRSIELPVNNLSYQYIPVRKLENTSAPCILSATSISNTGESSTALINLLYPDTETSQANAYVACNGELKMHTGGFLCQSQAGLSQMITTSFLPMFSEGSKNCNPLKPASVSPSPADFEIVLSEGFCTYFFGGKDKQTFTLVTYGFSKRK